MTNIQKDRLRALKEAWKTAYCTEAPSSKARKEREHRFIYVLVGICDDYNLSEDEVQEAMLECWTEDVTDDEDFCTLCHLKISLNVNACDTCPLAGKCKEFHAKNGHYPFRNK